MVPVQIADRTWLEKAAPEMLAMLSRNLILGTLPDDELTSLLKDCVVKEFKANRRLSRQGAPVKHIYFIWEGSAKAVFSGRNQSDSWINVNFLQPSSDIGLLSVVDGGPHSATVISLEQMLVIGIPIESLHRALDQHPDWYQIISHIALARLRNLGVWMDHLL